MSTEGYFLAAISSLASSVVFLFLWFKAEFKAIAKKLNDCEEDRLKLWAKIAEIAPGGMALLTKKP